MLRLNLFSRLNDGKVVIRGGRLHLALHKTGSVVPVDVAPDDPTTSEWVLREKPMPILTKVIQVAKATQLMDMGNHLITQLHL